ncbi:uncharacterized protein LOC143891422 [Tasmannia lanceolata]|uniref:uncharacterized protein LOC143891422 n=1 Tax=Tasmannia lanceolata TaxID=3420 RepID=UPI00406496AD
MCNEEERGSRRGDQELGSRMGDYEGYRSRMDDDEVRGIKGTTMRGMEAEGGRMMESVVEGGKEIQGLMLRGADMTIQIDLDDEAENSWVFLASTVVIHSGQTRCSSLR